MASVNYKAADYEIGPSSSKEFTFWWDSVDTGGYFDVSIAPVFNPDVASQQLPLVEVQRAYLLETSEPPALRTILLLTLRNDNDSTVYFTANHVLIN
jgi:hypothetical protein